VIAIWNGGIAMYGSVIGGALALFIVSRIKKYNKNQMLKVFDMVAPGVMLGQIIGRWGNL
jgi:phosphatidylglycerol:prolipoprotein diacylglycerol transferase